MTDYKFPFTRRDFLKTGGAVGAASLVGSFPMPAISAPKTIKIGFVTPQTGPLAVFGGRTRVVQNPALRPNER